MEGRRYSVDSVRPAFYQNVADLDIKGKISVVKSAVRPNHSCKGHYTTFCNYVKVLSQYLIIY